MTSEDPKALAGKAAASASIAADHAADAQKAVEIVRSFTDEVRSLRQAVDRSARRAHAWRLTIIVGAILIISAIGTLYFTSLHNAAAIKANCEGRNTIATVLRDVLLDAEHTSDGHLARRDRAFYRRSLKRLGPIPCTAVQRGEP